MGIFEMPSETVSCCCLSGAMLLFQSNASIFDKQIGSYPVQHIGEAIEGKAEKVAGLVKGVKGAFLDDKGQGECTTPNEEEDAIAYGWNCAQWCIDETALLNGINGIA